MEQGGCWLFIYREDEKEIVEADGQFSEWDRVTVQCPDTHFNFTTTTSRARRPQPSSQQILVSEAPEEVVIEDDPMPEAGQAENEGGAGNEPEKKQDDTVSDNEQMQHQ